MLVIRYVVRVVIFHNAPKPLPDQAWFPVLDALSAIGTIKIQRRDKEGACFDFLTPPGWIDHASRYWSERRASILSNMGLNAVCAPECP